MHDLLKECLVSVFDSYLQIINSFRINGRNVALLKNLAIFKMTLLVVKGVRNVLAGKFDELFV